jgi:hypothetical protein
MACNFKLPTIALPVPSFALPKLPSLPSFKPPRLDFPMKLSLPKLALPIPSFALPPLPSLPSFKLSPSLLELGFKLPKLPTIALPIPSFALPKLPSLPSFKVKCPFD